MTSGKPEQIDHGSCWAEAMRQLRFEAAWQISDAELARRRHDSVDCRDWPRHEQFLYDGSDLHDRHVRVRFYHGLGDSLMVARFLPRLRRRARHVTAWVAPKLIEILRTIGGVDRFEALHEGSPSVDCDVEIESMELLHALRVQPAELDGARPYLRPPRRRVSRTSNGAARVGLCWQAGGWDPRRSIGIERIRPLLRTDITWYSLQYPDQPRELPLIPLDESDLMALAARILDLDLVITVDTMVAHMAGALAVPTWTMLPASADWRWGSSARTPWYESMRLWRQQVPGDWSFPLARITSALDQWVAPYIEEASYRQSDICRP